MLIWRDTKMITTDNLSSLCSSTMPPVICKCRLCSAKTIILNGVEQPGQQVDASTRSRHEKRDAGPSRSKQKQVQQVSPASMPTDRSPQQITFPVADIVKMVCMLAIWLHIRAGISRSVANTILRAIQLIISTTLYLVGAALSSSGMKVKLASVNVPSDVRTAYKLYCTEPDIIRTACCPSCFSLFSHPIPQKCQWKASPRSRPCNTELWQVRNTRKGPKWVPRRLYSTQSFDSWLRFFLSRQIIEDSLQETFRHRINRPLAAFGADMNDIQDSPAWIALNGFVRSPYHLVFGIYIDWFNPFTNKIAGKHASCGAIVLYCLNLAPHLRYLPENTFIIGLTPPPSMPDAMTICHLLEPVISSVGKYADAPGQLVPTHQHQNGVAVKVRTAPLIADLEGSKKASGFMHHHATKFCTFCLLENTQIEDLNLQSWQLRNGTQVRAEAEKWRQQITKVARNNQAKATGVRWTPLHSLPYWDPVKHVVLGFMHNWLEGILQHHLRTLWGIGQSEDETQKAKEIGKDEEWSDTDMSDSADELDDLSQEAADFAARPQTPPMSLSPSPTSMSLDLDSDSSSSSTPTPMAAPYAFSDDEDDSDDDYIPLDDTIAFHFTDAQLQAIRDCIHDVTLPTWVQRPPTNLGEPSHGKLKAREYLTLFTCVLPLIIPEFWYTPTAPETHQQHFHCFYNLVSATNIISSFKTSNADADAYTEHYIQYRAAIQRLFPHNPSKPNHHYAMHNGALLKYWGPLASFSEFPGERMNGLLQNIKTNHRLRDLDFTMLRQMSRQAHIQAMLHDNVSNQGLANILEPEDADSTSASLTPSEAATVLAKAPSLGNTEYAALLYYLQHTGRPYRAFDNFPHPPNSMILPPNAQQPLYLHRDKRTFSCEQSHKGNSAICFYNPLTQANDTGSIQKIWRLPLEGLMHTFITVCLHRALSAAEEALAPFKQCPGFLTRIVDAQPSDDVVIIEPTHIICHLTTLSRKEAVYGIERETKVVCWALNRGRR
ncbi:hypothetical protein Hypma_010543 [Hypsizygus marmoreus]|uniref:Transposase domain-containing protein n=1 Tax=Hypsizygus marmoreus TaxID=39966 RepID=A0A369JPM9_HYPMA|nr:hypothetical protein Hypma_010543 [Hypsizygus marmoreus]